MLCQKNSLDVALFDAGENGDIFDSSRSTHIILIEAFDVEDY
jgi:hypothetical protein